MERAEYMEKIRKQNDIINKAKEEKKNLKQKFEEEQSVLQFSRMRV